MIRWGLCCQFLDAPIKFRTATHRYVSGLDAAARRDYLAAIARDNADALARAVERCHEIGVGAFRINSQILPLATHPVSGYALGDLDDGEAGALEAAFAAVRPLAHARGVRLSLHPDQFVVLNSEREAVRDASRQELEFQCWVAEVVGADTVTLHVGGAAGGKPAALERLARAVDQLSPRARARLALENDDRLFTPEDLLPFCARTELAMVYDAHHHRCNPDALSVEDATLRAATTWAGRDATLAPTAREPYFHVSSPRDGWDARNPRPHADYIDPADLPPLWRDLALTVDVEAKAKERAVLDIKGRVEQGAVR
ncbi:UV DNA damage repair endonuclease UvsE [Roseisolibacter agri]|uniref:UV DNA damage endonuclease n=1 Tax=Roseisolibacter agri TaxID=2014610 RepID=A0AA37Q4I4_9BACT|nr:UV DNA damage repair endonuclease UvsE [Roseisolibacter agri]GLC24472.1 UV DNA damage endonuclease [Roseisolibacter agri]